MLRDYQAAQLQGIELALDTGTQSVLAVAPTGSGKTVGLAELARRRAAGGVLIVAHREELIVQAAGKLDCDHGIIMPGYPRRAAQVQVTSIQTIVNRLGMLPPLGLIIPDEAHHSVSPSWRKLFASQPRAQRVGYTATPERLDGTGLGDVYEQMVEGPSIRWLIDHGFLVPARVFGAPGGAPDLGGVRSLGGEYRPDDLALVMDRPAIVGNAVEHYESLCSGQPALAFCSSVRAAHTTTAAFQAEGYRWATVWGDMDLDARRQAFAGLASGALHGLSSCGLIDEGIDVPRVSVIIDLAPSKALGRVMQRWGRAMRPARGKACWFLLDHAGNVVRRSGVPNHGLPDTVRDWSLVSRKRTRTPGAPVPPVAQCPNCYAMHKPAPRCPVCDHDYALSAAPRITRQLDGQLVEITELPKLVIPPSRKRDELLALAKARGYNRRWVDIQMQFAPRPPREQSNDGSEFEI